MTVAVALDLSQNVAASLVSPELLATMPAKFQAAAAKNCKVFGFNVYSQGKTLAKRLQSTGLLYTCDELQACCIALAYQCQAQAISGSFYAHDYSLFSKADTIKLASAMLKKLAEV